MKKLLLTTVLGLAMVLGTASFALAENTTGDIPALGEYPGSLQYDPATDLPDGDIADNGIGNANKTGDKVDTDNGSTATDVIKTDGMNNKFGLDGTQVQGDVTQRTHGEFQTNTNACASCHQTHTAAADKLLFKDGVYNTCTACHDGTLGFYNVFQPSTAGTFGGTAGGNASVHMATGVMQTKAAPGGNTVADTEDALGDHNWTGEFNCASCHAPHGSYSDRLLSYNPNFVASVETTQGGQMVRATVTDTIPATVSETDPTYLVVQTTVGNVPIYNSTSDAVEYTFAGKYIDATNGAVTPLLGTNNVVVVLKKVTKKDGTFVYTKDTQPWVNAGEYKHDHSYKVNFSKFYPVSALPELNLGDVTDPTIGDPQITVGLTWNHQSGFAVITGTLKNKPGKSYPNVIATTYTTLVGQEADISRAFVTKLAMYPDASYSGGVAPWFGAVGSGVKITQVDVSKYDSTGEGVAISTFCAACHTDYMAKSSDDTTTGQWSQAYRHTTTSDNYTCLKCHFAHGTDATIMLDAQSRDIADVAGTIFNGDPEANTKAINYMVDKNASSALKRFTNMSVCWKCHTSSHNYMLMNNEYVNNVKYDANTANDLTNGFSWGDITQFPYWKADGKAQQTPTPILPVSPLP